MSTTSEGRPSNKTAINQNGEHNVWRDAHRSFLQTDFAQK